MPRHDYKCPGCGKVEEHANVKHPADVQCAECFCAMQRLPAAPAFAIKGFSAANGYSEKKG